MAPDPSSQEILVAVEARGVLSIRRAMWRTISATLVSVGPTLWLVAALLAARPMSAAAQAYYGLEGGRPGRIGDASPTPRGSLDVELLPIRFEQYEGGARRWRSDPKLSLGVAPFTEIEIRVPILRVDPGVAGSQAETGVGGVAVGVLRALTIETGAVPALAVGGEYVAPIGSQAASSGSYSGGLFLTKTFTGMRVHLNASAGTWSTRAPKPIGPTPCPTTVPPGTVLPPGCVPPPPPDVPCDRVPAAGLSFACLPGSGSTLAANSSSAQGARADSAGILSGPRFMAGIAIDHAIALSSTLLVADFVVERFVDLYDTPDLTAEVGVRQQLTPQFVLDVGVGRRFGGVTRATSVTLGLSYELPVGRGASVRRADR
jgi:hypothetical protein